MYYLHEGEELIGDQAMELIDSRVDVWEEQSLRCAPDEFRLADYKQLSWCLDVLVRRDLRVT